jgi:hypothetical protein
MKPKPSAFVYKTDRTPPRLFKGSTNPENLPTGAEHRRGSTHGKMEKTTLAVSE